MVFNFTRCQSILQNFFKVLYDMSFQRFLVVQNPSPDYNDSAVSAMEYYVTAPKRRLVVQYNNIVLTRMTRFMLQPSYYYRRVFPFSFRTAFLENI